LGVVKESKSRSAVLDTSGARHPNGRLQSMQFAATLGNPSLG
jgi:hypothetical protein